MDAVFYYEKGESPANLLGSVVPDRETNTTIYLSKDTYDNTIALIGKKKKGLSFITHKEVIVDCDGKRLYYQPSKIPGEY